MGGWRLDRVCNTLTVISYYSGPNAMSFTVRLPRHREQTLAIYCARHGLSKDQALVRALERLLRDQDIHHPFIGGDAGDGSDVSGSIRTALRQYRMPS